MAVKPDSYYGTAVHVAAAFGSEDCFKLLFERSKAAFLNEPGGTFGASLLGLCVDASKPIGLAKMLVAAGADLKAVSPSTGLSHIQTLVTSGAIGSCEALFQANTEAFTAAASPSLLFRVMVPGTATFLVKQFAWDPNAASNPSLCEVLKEFITLKANVDAADEQGNTPLHLARGDSVKILVDAGASLKSKNKNGDTPAMSMARSADAQALGVLLPAAKDDVGGAGNTLAHVAATSSLPVLLAVIAAGGNIQATNDAGETPLHVVVSYDMVEPLLAAPRRPSALLSNPTVKANLPPAVAQHVIDAADVTLVTKQGRSLFHVAVTNFSTPNFSTRSWRNLVSPSRRPPRTATCSGASISSPTT